MAVTSNGAMQGIPNTFEWNPEYNSLLERIALTDVFDTEWPHIRDIIRHKIDHNVRQYMLGESEDPQHIDSTKTPEQLPRSSPITLPSATPSPYAPSLASPSVHPGLIIPPFPTRERRNDAPMRIYNNVMDEAEADELKSRIFEQLQAFDSPPFTIQRVCELCIQPRKHYKTVGKYLRAVERTVLVTSTKDAYPSDIIDEDVELTSTYGNLETMRLASTPLMSPIPFLHDDARRSRSPSPFELAATKRPVGASVESLSADTPPSSVRQPFGLVDELDDPKPGHLADRPTALTSVTSSEPNSIPLSLNERFVKSSTSESDGESRDVPETAESRQAEDAEVEDMVLDESTLEDEDKENRPS